MKKLANPWIPKACTDIDQILQISIKTQDIVKAIL